MQPRLPAVAAAWTQQHIWRHISGKCDFPYHGPGGTHDNRTQSPLLPTNTLPQSVQISHGKHGAGRNARRIFMPSTIRSAQGTWAHRASIRLLSSFFWKNESLSVHSTWPSKRRRGARAGSSFCADHGPRSRPTIWAIPTRIVRWVPSHLPSSLAPTTDRQAGPVAGLSGGATFFR